MGQTGGVGRSAMVAKAEWGADLGRHVGERSAGAAVGRHSQRGVAPSLSLSRAERPLEQGRVRTPRKQQKKRKE